MQCKADDAVNVLVTGGSSQIGHFLLPLLVQQGYAVTSVSRKPAAVTSLAVEGVRWVQGDLQTAMQELWQHNRATVWIHLAYLPLAVAHLKAAADGGVCRFIGFSSTSIFTKQASASSEEQKTVQQLLAAEETLREQAPRLGVAWTLFRPTMIYGCGMDRNIAFIQRMISRFGFFPIAGSGKGLRQPVHAEDLANACMQALSVSATKNKAYNLSGGETLCYREVVMRVFNAMHRPARVIALSPAWYKWTISIVRRCIPRYAFIQPAMVDRMNKDMVFDHADAARDFGFNPRHFQP